MSTKATARPRSDQGRARVVPPVPPEWSAPRAGGLQDHLPCRATGKVVGSEHGLRGRQGRKCQGCRGIGNRRIGVPLEKWSPPDDDGRQTCLVCAGEGILPPLFRDCRNCDGEGYLWI